MAHADETATRTEIHDALRRYCRGIDRLDPRAVASAFHPGATLHDYGPAPMTIETFVEHAMGSLATKYAATTHRISNTLIEFVDQDPASGAALVETYVLADHVRRDEGGDELHTFAGRYIDRFTSADGRWLIAERTLRNDWSRIVALGEPMRGSYVASGRGDRPDPIDAHVRPR